MMHNIISLPSPCKGHYLCEWEKRYWICPVEQVPWCTRVVGEVKIQRKWGREDSHIKYWQ